MTQLEQISPVAEIPREVLDKYPVTAERIKLLGGGLVNSTYIVEGQDTRIILQKLGDVIQPELITDADVYTRHLERDGWEAPLLQRTKDGEISCTDTGGNMWRALDFIESDEAEPIDPDNNTLGRMGSLLARWHRTMSWLDYQPTYGIPHFHDTGHHADRLTDSRRNLPSIESSDVAEEILDSYSQLEQLPRSPAQLLHGDPKLNNILYRRGKPFTFIDYDTVMHGPIWLDIGDMLRSVLKNDITNGRPVEKDRIDSVVEGYFDAARPGIRLEEFVTNAILATKHISLELAMRYLNDISDENYFNWDSELYNSRHDNHLERARLQWQLFTELEN